MKTLRLINIIPERRNGKKDLIIKPPEWALNEDKTIA